MNSVQTKLLFGQRLLLARNMAGLSLRNLSDKIGGVVSHTALAKYERGDMMPDSSLLIVLGRALNQKPGFFFRPMQPPIAEIKFRARQDKVGEKELLAIRRQAQDYFERYLEIENILGIAQAFKNPLSGLKMDGANGGEKAAAKVREVWQLGTQPLGNLVELLEANGIKIYEVPCHPDFDGFSGWMDGHPIITVGEHLDGQPTRKRHTLLHELGHLLLKDRLSGISEEKVVAQFAAALTIPKDKFVELLGGHRSSLSLEELIDIKAVWGISISSIAVRAHDLGLIAQATYRRFWDQWGSDWKKKKKEPGDDKYEGLEKSTRFSRLVHRAIAEGLITRSKAANILNVSLDDLRLQVEIIH